MTQNATTIERQADYSLQHWSQTGNAEVCSSIEADITKNLPITRNRDDKCDRVAMSHL